jgi:hypothetical protein
MIIIGHLRNVRSRDDLGGRRHCRATPPGKSSRTHGEGTVVMGHPAPRVELVFDHDIDTESADGVEIAFQRHGFVTVPRRRLPHRGPDEFTWLMLAALPLQAFLSGIGREVVTDVYARAKQLAVHRKKDKNGDNRAPLVLQDVTTELKIVLDADLPAEAIGQLVGLDLGAYQAGPLHYDQHQRKWRSELDEAKG